MKLSIVGLPIGNIEDISFRAVRVISESEMVVCEDSRMFSNLWTKLVQLGMAEKYGGRIKFVNDFNEYRVLPNIVEEIGRLERVVLVSDAGMPVISDPGFRLIREAISFGWEIEVVPGPTAESALVAISGLPPEKYLFIGFLPKKEGKKKSAIAEAVELMKSMKVSVVLYESPQRTVKTLEAIKEIGGDSVQACLGIDLTKISQKVIRGTVGEVIEQVGKTVVKGEVAMELSLRD